VATRTDILLRDDDLSIVGGDFEMGVSDPQHVYHILLNPPGSYKQYPLTGLGKAPVLNGTFDSTLRRKIQLQLEGDGYRLTAIKMDETTGIDIKFNSV
jgi:hypothetical protein